MGQQRTGGIERTLNPKTIAIVGVSDHSPVANFVAMTLESDAEVFLVHPKHADALGRPTFETVADIGKPIDAVFSALSAERSVGLVEECAELGCGGVIVYAAGFTEAGGAGKGLQSRLRAAASPADMAIVGPNCLGWIDVPRGIRLAASSEVGARPGGISLVSHSGAMITAVATASAARTGTGINHLISAGNEAVTDIADYVDYLASDPATTAIALIVESIRRPAEFFDAVARARRAGKPVAALKLARSNRTRAMASSHTGALAGDAWAYDVAFAEAGVIEARDPEDLIDRLSIAAQLGAGHRGPARHLGVVATTGGLASLASDVAEQEQMHLPQLDGLADWVAETIPGVSVPNPLDTTGFGAQHWTQIVEQYLDSPDLDAALFVSNWGEQDDSPTGRWLLEEVRKKAATVAKPVVVATGAGPIGSFGPEIVGDAQQLALGFGIRPSIRGLAALETLSRPAAGLPTSNGDRLPRPDPADVVRAGEVRSLSFAASMRLLSDHGIPVAPWAFADDLGSDGPSFSGPYVAKLADIPHRTEFGAVRTGVQAGSLSEATDSLRKLALRHGLPDKVAIQQMVPVEGELLLGIDGRSELGAIALLGLGGVFAELLGKIAGGMAPLTTARARELIDQFADVPVLHGHRGSDPWDLDALADILVAVGELADRSRSWLESMDINPLIWGHGQFVAVDALCVLRD